tara:strand:+ start:156 stop:488 length:333 start_codon:yes stop_codon:yes gene_type:complete
MAVLFKQLQLLGPNDLRVTLRDEAGIPFDPYEITYAFYGETQTRGLFLVGHGERAPVRESEGVYYVGETLTTEFIARTYYVEWTIKRTDVSPKEIVGRKEFAVVSYNYNP